MSGEMLEVYNVKPGYIVVEDIYKNTVNPIIRKDTVLTEEHLDVLNAFGIKEIMITKEKSEVIRDTDDLIETQQEQEEKNGSEMEKTSIEQMYVKAVGQMKREYAKWQSGIRPDITELRAIIVPLLNKLKKPEEELTFLTTVSIKDDYICHHLVAVGLLAYSMGKKLGLTTGEAIQLGIAGTLIDSGMARISPAIVQKTKGLTNKEYNEIKKHAIYSYQMIQDTPLLRIDMKQAILQHHERLDGSGYPRGLKGDDISLYAQILGAADVYHARTSDRVYRSKESPYKVLDSFRSTYEQFHVHVVNALYEVAGKLSIGTRVQLSNEQRAIIIYLHQNEPFRPVVRLDEDDAIVDLAKERSIMINHIILNE